MDLHAASHAVRRARVDGVDRPFNVCPGGNGYLGSDGDWKCDDAPHGVARAAGLALDEAHEFQGYGGALRHGDG